MSCPTSPNSESAAPTETDRQAAERAHPDGSTYLSHLWEAIKDVDSVRKVCFVSRSAPLGDIPVRAFYRQYQYASGSRQARHELWFDVPDAVYQRVQRSYADRFMHDMFGVTPVWPDANLPKAFHHGLADLPRLQAFLGEAAAHSSEFSHYTCTIIGAGNWVELKAAIGATVLAAESSLVSAPMVSLGGYQTARAKLRDGELLLSIEPNVVRAMESLWLEEFRDRLGVKTHRH